jgi:glycosyltransferase involved in cell wall biosynthesis
LPIVEAALHGVPALASDIPVFHEVGGDGALYFSLESPGNLAEAVDRIASLSKEERLAMAKKINVLTWKESTEMFMGVINNSELIKNKMGSHLAPMREI